MLKYGITIAVLLGVAAGRPQDPAAVAPAASAPAAAAPAAPAGNGSAVTFTKNEVKPLDGMGNYMYDIELSDGTKLVQMGHTQPPAPGATDSVLVVQGSYSYVAPDGKTISISYTADDKGFVAMGDAIPSVAAPAAGAAAPPPAAGDNASAPAAPAPAATGAGSVAAASPPASSGFAAAQDNFAPAEEHFAASSF